MVERGEKLWLHRVEDAVLMLEVKPSMPQDDPAHAIGQVVLKRLISAEQVIELLCSAEAVLDIPEK